jgi:transcriptional regulator with XRE-family HTH domain
MTNIGEILAYNIKTYRKNLGLSQAKLADKVNTATNYIGMIELGKQFPSPAMIEKIAQALDVESPMLFSTHAVPARSVEKLHKSILMDIEKVIADRLQEYEETQ